MSDFAEQFLPGYAWLVVNGFASVRMGEARPRLVGVSMTVPDEQVRTFPPAAQLAFIAVRDSLEEIRSKAGGSGMDDIFRLLQTPMMPAVLFSALTEMREGKDAE